MLIVVILFSLTRIQCVFSYNRVEIPTTPHPQLYRGSSFKKGGFYKL